MIFEEITTLTRSVLMASGTIAPIESFVRMMHSSTSFYIQYIQVQASELGVPFRIRLEARHVVNVSQQVCVGWLGETSTGSSNSKSLRATYRDVSRFLYQDALGRVVTEIVRTRGVHYILFFKKYTQHVPPNTDRYVPPRKVEYCVSSLRTTLSQLR